MADTNPTTVLADPLAIELMTAPIPGRFAYIGRDGAPRVVPMRMTWSWRMRSRSARDTDDCERPSLCSSSADVAVPTASRRRMDSVVLAGMAPA
jgi:hypothetical protein